MQIREVIKVADPESITLDGVDEAMQELGFQTTVNPDYALEYGRGIVKFLTEALNNKAVTAGVFPQIEFADRRLQTPRVDWGVTGIINAAGTYAAMRAMEREADAAGYTGLVSSVAPEKVEDYATHTRVWFTFELIDPQLRRAG